ncbi:clathrin coat assembly protein AP180A [Monosporozyma servazzii]
MTTYVKLVKGATKIKMAPPKSKYIDPILLGSQQREDFGEIMDALSHRVNDTAWTVVYKSLIVLHLLIRDGEKDVTLNYLCQSYHMDQFFNVNNSLLSQGQSNDVKILTKYSKYLKVRCNEFARIKKNYVRDEYKKLKIVIDSNDLKSIDTALNQVDSLECQVDALIRVKFSQYDLSNELLLYSFKLLIYDLLPLYNALNEGIITLLESFFELSHTEADRTLQLYKKFVTLTDIVVKYLKMAKNIGLRIPVIKHITTKLVKSLEDHLAEDDRTHNTFNQSSSTEKNPASFTQQRLEEIRKQKAELEQQLTNQHVLLPSQTTASTNSNGFNPFAQAQNQVTSPAINEQLTNNPFMSAALPQQQVVPQSQPNLFNATTMPVLPQQPAMQQPAMQQQQPIMEQQHIMQQQPIMELQQPVMQQQQPIMQQQQPSMQQQMPQHSATFPSISQQGMFNHPQQQTTLNTTQTIDELQPLATGSNNPFAMNNITKQVEQRQEVNPFSQANYTNTSDFGINNTATNAVSHNPFSLGNAHPQVQAPTQFSQPQLQMQNTQPQLLQQQTQPQLQNQYTQPSSIQQFSQPQIQQQHTQPQLQTQFNNEPFNPFQQQSQLPQGQGQVSQQYPQQFPQLQQINQQQGYNQQQQQSYNLIDI